MKTNQKLLKKIELTNFRSYNKYVSIDLYTRAPNKQTDYSVGDVELNQFKYKTNKWVNSMTGIMGVNASGKTSLLEGIEFGYEALNGKLIKKIIERVRRRIRMSHFQPTTIKNEKNNDNTGEMINIMKIVNNVMNDIVEKFSINGDGTNSKIILNFTDESSGDVSVGNFESADGKYSDIRIQTNKINSPISIREIVFSISKGLANNAQSNDMANKIINDSILFKELNVSFYQGSKFKVNFLSERSRYKELFESLREKLTNDKFMKLVQRLDNNIDDITTNDIVVLKDGARLEAQKLSNGTKKMLWNINEIINIKTTGGLILVDEIENGLNLSLIKLLIKNIELDIDINMQNPVQMIFTTHSNTIQATGIVDPNNTLFIEDGSISKINTNKEGKNDSIPWKDQRISSFKNKNFWNDSYWDSKKMNSKSTLSNYEIDKILEIIDG